MSVNYDGHWVAIDTIKDGVVYMMDPAQNKNNKLFDYYDTDGMIQVRLYKGKNTPSKADTGTSGGTSSSSVYLTGHYKTTSALNLRKSYTTSSDVLLTIPEGQTVVVKQVYNNQWGQVEYNNKTGWIFLEYTRYTESNYYYKTGTYKISDQDGAKLRTGIGADKSSICVVPYNTQVMVSFVKDNWGKVTYGSNSGYICMEYMSYVSTPVTTTATTAITTTHQTTTTVPTTTTTTPATTVPLTPGDINHDGKINDEDVLCLNIYLSDPYEIYITDYLVYDLNSDGIISTLDVVYLMKLIRQ